MAYASNNPGNKEKKEKKDNASNTNGKYSHQFVRYTPDKRDKDAIKAFSFERVDFLDWMDTITQDGYKVSISPDRKNDCVLATLTCSVEGSPNNGFILTARGIDARAALCWLYWLHAVRFETVWVVDTMGGWEL